MTHEQQHYVQKRLQQIRWWNRLGWLFFVALAGFYGWLWQHKPLYIDPMLLLDKLRLGQVSDIEIAKLAALGNLAFIGCGMLLASLVLLIYASLWTEKKSILILSSLTVKTDPTTTESSEDEPRA